MTQKDSKLSEFTRRGFLIGGSAGLISARTLWSAPACTLVAEQEVGPYYIETGAVRQNITEGRPGVPLELRIAVLDAKRCVPLPNAAVDIWHCDALGAYSGFTAQSMNRGQGPGGPRGFLPPSQNDRPAGQGMPPPPDGFGGPGRDRGFGPPPAARVTDAARFLRGIQITDQNGFAKFNTIYPGWYQGRCIHIHARVRLGGDHSKERYAGGHVSHTGQLFFPEDVTQSVARLSPYADHADVERTLQSEDGVFVSQNGSPTILQLSRLTPRSNEAGFMATVTIAVDPDAVPAPVGFGGRRRGTENG